MSSERPANRLANETSPYLLQHAHNPVDWHPWGPEALELARQLDRPVFLSIGYSACHWCHVMERESFEDERIAKILSDHFVSIKVDREERPDVDELYMKFVTSSTGAGGWPMSVFLTPDREPFFGGTYFPPTRRFGRPGFDEVLLSISETWRKDRSRLDKAAGWFRDQLERETSAKTVAPVDPEILERAAQALLGQFDPQWGGFGNAPKFPHAMDIRLLLRHWQRSGSETSLAAVTRTLDRMADGGIFDQLGGGFHRYSTDEKWLIPHFEKMLYDNALLVPPYLEAHVATGNARYADVVRATCEWVLREMVTPEGGFASTQDADSEGEEGKFFAWTPDELEQVLGQPDCVWAAAWFGVTEDGNFEHGRSALWRPDSPEDVAAKLHVDVSELEAAIERARPRLFEHRAQRIAPDTDDKVLAAWNGLMIGALAQAHQVLDEPRYLDAARSAARYVIGSMRQPDGRLFATARHGRAHLNAYLDDYAFVIGGLIDLYEADFDPAWIRTAIELAEIVEREFADSERGGWFTTGASHEELLARLKGHQDGALPSGNAVQTLNLLRLAELTGNVEFAKLGERAILSSGELVNRYPHAFSQTLIAVDFVGGPPCEVVVAGELDDPSTAALLRSVRRSFRPQKVVALADARADAELIPLVADRSPGSNGALAYVCENWACQAPTGSADELASALEASSNRPAE